MSLQAHLSDCISLVSKRNDWHRSWWIIALLSVFALYREGVAWLNSPAGEALPASIHESFTLDESFKVLGYDVNATTFHAGDRLIVRVYW